VLSDTTLIELSIQHSGSVLRDEDGWHTILTDAQIVAFARAVIAEHDATSPLRALFAATATEYAAQKVYASAPTGRARNDAWAALCAARDARWKAFEAATAAEAPDARADGR
jgi:hypothetical protein